MTTRIDLAELSRRENEQTEWRETLPTLTMSWKRCAPSPMICRTWAAAMSFAEQRRKGRKWISTTRSHGPDCKSDTGG